MTREILNYYNATDMIDCYNATENVCFYNDMRG